MRSPGIRCEQACFSLVGGAHGRATSVGDTHFDMESVDDGGRPAMTHNRNLTGISNIQIIRSDR
jgi:hypothetical protein